LLDIDIIVDIKLIHIFVSRCVKFSYYSSKNFRIEKDNAMTLRTAIDMSWNRPFKTQVLERVGLFNFSRSSFHANLKFTCKFEEGRMLYYTL